MDHIVSTCNSITIQLCAAHFMNRCRMFLLPFGNPHMGNPPQSILYWYVTDWFKSPLDIYCSLRLGFIGYKCGTIVSKTYSQ